MGRAEEPIDLPPRAGTRCQMWAMFRNAFGVRKHAVVRAAAHRPPPACNRLRLLKEYRHYCLLEEINHA